MEALIEEKEKYDTDVILLIPRKPPVGTRCPGAPCTACTGIQR